jgi:hypothetical protein
VPVRRESVQDARRPGPHLPRLRPGRRPGHGLRGPRHARDPHRPRRPNHGAPGVCPGAQPHRFCSHKGRKGPCRVNRSAVPAPPGAAPTRQPTPREPPDSGPLLDKTPPTGTGPPRMRPDPRTSGTRPTSEQPPTKGTPHPEATSPNGNWSDGIPLRDDS